MLAILLRGRWWCQADIKELKQQRRRRLRKRHSKWEFELLQTLSRLFHLVQFVKCWQFFLELNSKRLYGSSRKEKENRCLVFTSYRKREIRHFYVVVVQWRKKEIRRNVHKRVMHVQSCFFFLPIYTQCFFAVLSWRRRLRCPVLPLKVSLAVMRELKKYL